MRGVLDRLALRVAVAMEDPAVRTEIHDDLHGSPNREGKIHFRSLLLSQGDFLGRPSRLAAAMQLGFPGGLESLVSSLDSLVDLEFYIPVHDHRVSWRGDANLVVASAVRDHVIPTGYRVGGEAFVFMSAEDPPEIPVLAIVPREGIVRRAVRPLFDVVDCDPFAIEPCPGEGGGGSAPLTQPTAPGLWMNHSVIPDDHEGFMMGDPEFEVVLASQTQISGGFNKEIQCAGEHAAELGTNQPGIKAPAFIYDQNVEDWRGLVQIATLAQLQEAQASDSASMIMIWEDDNEACRIRKGESNVQDFVNAVANAVSAAQAFARGDIFLGTISAAGLGSRLITLLGSLQSDDVVGMVVLAQKVGLQFPDATHVLLKESGQVEGRVNLVLKPAP